LWTAHQSAEAVRLQELLRKKNHAGEPSNHNLGRSRGGFGTKVHMVADGEGNPLHFELSPGQAHESQYGEQVLSKTSLPRRGPGKRRSRPVSVVCDKGYSSGEFRFYLRSRGIRPIIPKKKKEKYQRIDFDWETYRKRNGVERCIGWMKENRGFATRFDKLSLSYAANVKLAMIQRYFRKLDSINRA
jgi:transposase